MIQKENWPTGTISLLLIAFRGLGQCRDLRWSWDMCVPSLKHADKSLHQIILFVTNYTLIFFLPVNCDSWLLCYSTVVTQCLWYPTARRTLTIFFNQDYHFVLDWKINLVENYSFGPKGCVCTSIHVWPICLMDFSLWHIFFTRCVFINWDNGEESSVGLILSSKPMILTLPNVASP